MWVPYYSKSFKQRKLINQGRLKNKKIIYTPTTVDPIAEWGCLVGEWQLSLWPEDQPSFWTRNSWQLLCKGLSCSAGRKFIKSKAQGLAGAGRILCQRHWGAWSQTPIALWVLKRQGDQRQDFFTVARMILWLPVTRVPFKFCFLSGNLVQSPGKCCPQYPKVNQILAGGWGQFFFAIGGCKANSLSFPGCGGSLWALSEWLPRKIQSPEFYPHSRPTQP